MRPTSTRSSLIPSRPTVATLYQTPALGGKWFSIESIIAEEVVRELIPELIRNGAVGIVEYRGGLSRKLRGLKGQPYAQPRPSTGVCASSGSGHVSP